MDIYAFFLLVHISIGINGRLLCGDSLSQYDPRKHFCKDGSILIKSRASLPKHLVCGEHFTMYDNATHSCENGSVILRTPPPQSITMNSVTASTRLSGNVCRQRLVINCSGNVYESCAKKGTYDCCGGRSYQPAYDSCCNSLVYKNKPQRKHICCKSTLYQRKKSSAPCQRNDAFLQGGGKAKSLASKNMRSFICNRGDKYAYYMKITGPHRDENGRYLTAIRITKYIWLTCANACPINERRTKVRIPLDEFSPSSLGRRSFLILSNYEYLLGDHFYRREGDVVYKAPRKKKLLFRQLTKIRKACSL